MHLGKNDASIQQAREQLGIDAVIGVSCYNAIDLAQSAQNQDANYVAFGALFHQSPNLMLPNVI
ncbi:Thiamin-phosphate pyrophosphorylase (EC [uncultured Gammaproteobacteria bacterium]|nr:Thiamin-phosphate pyrophosphorylase (EC [uncultured Gammaproteobacteria bacterium]